MNQSEDHVITVKMDGVPNYSLLLKLSTQAKSADQMTVLMYAVDFVKEQVGLNPESEIALFFD